MMQQFPLVKNSSNSKCKISCCCNQGDFPL